jgi:hypothetical protein
MSFATATNGSAINFLTGGNVQKIAELVTFPTIEGRDAPGKTGAAAKPALVNAVAVTVRPVSSDITVTLQNGMWTSTGTGFVGSSNYSPAFVDSFKKQSITPRPVFSGTKYFVGFAIINPVLVSFANYGVVWGHAAGDNTARLDRTFYSTSTNFVDQVLFGTGPIAYQLDYDVLPTQPLALASVISGPADQNVTLTWDAVSSDGGQAVSGYRIQQSQDNITWTTIAANTGTATRSFTTSELTPGVRYYFRVAAINAVAIAHGTDYSGPYSASAEILIPGAVPGNAQSFLTATVANPDPLPVAFSDFGPGIRFTQIDVQYGSEFLYTEIEASTQDAFGEIQVTDAPQSKALYGVRSYSITNLLNSTDLGAFEVAKDYLTYYYQPELRVQSITVDLSNLTIEQKLAVLGLEIDSFITVSFTPNGVGDPKVASGLVTGISHRITLTSHEVELRLRNERNLFTLNSESKGILNVNTLGP